MAKNMDNYYICPYSGIEFKNTCPVTNCPANISDLPDRPSGCFLNFMHKTDISKFEVAYVLNMSVRAVEICEAEGKEAIRCVTLFNEVVQQLRLLNMHKLYCPRCGVLRTSKGPCLNKDKCTERLNIAQRLLNQYPFNIEEFGMTKEDIFKLFHNRVRINKYLKSKEEGASIRTITQIPKPVYNHLIELNAKV